MYYGGQHMNNLVFQMSLIFSVVFVGLAAAHVIALVIAFFRGEE